MIAINILTKGFDTRMDWHSYFLSFFLEKN